MPHVLRVPSDVTLEALRSALAGVRAARVAVIFPLGQPCGLGNTETIRELHSYALILSKDVVVVGGDEHLRAVAVAAGFAAATSLEEWEETQPELRAVTVRGATTRPLSWELTDLALVRDDWFAVSSPSALDYPYTDEPPSYVKELLAADLTEIGDGGSVMVDGADDAAARDAVAASEDELDDDEREARALRDAHEHYEESITATIRQSGGVSRPLRFEIRRLTSRTATFPPADTMSEDDQPEDSPAL